MNIDLRACLLWKQQIFHAQTHLYSAICHAATLMTPLCRTHQRWLLSSTCRVQTLGSLYLSMCRKVGHTEGKGAGSKKGKGKQGEELVCWSSWNDMVGSKSHKILTLFKTKYTSEAMLVFPHGVFVSWFGRFSVYLWHFKMVSFF